MDEGHLSQGGEQTTHVHPVFSALPLALHVWMNGFSSETLLQLQLSLASIASKIRTRSGLGWGQDRVWRMGSERQRLGNKVRLWLSTDLTLPLFPSWVFLSCGPEAAGNPQSWCEVLQALPQITSAPCCLGLL